MRLTRKKRLHVLIAVITSVVLTSALLTLTTPSVNAATVDTSAWYVLVNRTSGKALDVYNLATADGARITQWAP
jgi:hypothetical protein